MIAIILAFVDKLGFAAFLCGEIIGTVTMFEIVINILATIFMLISVIATVFSGWDYLKKGKELFK